MNGQSGGWIEILSSNYVEELWTKLYKLVSKHSSIRNLYDSKRIPRDRLQDLYSDLTQDLFLRLHEKGRWQHYLDAGYTDADVEHELYHIEIPNLVSLLLRERRPEAYRMARRISNLIQTRPEFRQFTTASSQKQNRRKLILKVYGLSEWPDDKPVKSYQRMHELIKDVHYRKRDRRRAGRASTSHIIISNNDLTELLVEIFRAIDSPADVRIVRSLALSKLPIEDSQFISIDAAITPNENLDPEPLKVDFADQRPTPEEILLESETTREVDNMAVELLGRMREAVRNKPRRYSRLARVTWHCYFDQSSPPQTRIAKMIGISNSLVSHYRKLFDSIIQDVELDANQYIQFFSAFSTKLKASIAETAKTGDKRDGKPRACSNNSAGEFPVVAKSMAAVAASFR